jgi:hypothetical protein
MSPLLPMGNNRPTHSAQRLGRSICGDCLQLFYAVYRKDASVTSSPKARSAAAHGWAALDLQFQKVFSLVDY